MLCVKNWKKKNLEIGKNVTYCGNFGIVLSLRFCVKSILDKPDSRSSKNAFLPFQALWNYQCFQLVRVLATLHGYEKSSSLLHKKSFYEKVFQFQVSRVKKIKNSVVTLLRAKCIRFSMVSVFYNAAWRREV